VTSEVKELRYRHRSVVGFDKTDKAVERSGRSKRTNKVEELI
jgi:hypothetical protein